MLHILGLNMINLKNLLFIQRGDFLVHNTCYWNTFYPSHLEGEGRISLFGAYAAPNPAPDILSFCCDAKRKNIG